MSGMGPARPATTECFDLAEGPVWDGLRGTLSWVDITSGDVWQGRLEPGGAIELVDRWHFDVPVGAVVPASDGGSGICLGGRIAHRSGDGAVAVLHQIVDDVADPARRLNDAKTDPLGRLVAGTLREGASAKSETLIRLESDGSVTTIDEDLGLSNGLAWSADGALMYSVDTLSGVVYRRSYPDLGPREVHVEVGDGYPDGICVDAEEHLWVAVWGAGEVRRFDPDGRLVGTVRVPAPHASSVAFAGPDLDMLVITTARAELSRDQLVRWPDSGKLFTVDPGVRGLPATLWSGTTTNDRGGPS